MNLTLKRISCEASGIFGELIQENGERFSWSLEHAYVQPDGTYAPKIIDGTYTCQRSMHRLHNMTKDFETFEVMAVPNHTNILIHWGNWNDDSDGCILVGEAIASSQMTGKMITNSKKMFAEFMELQKGLDTFTLTVIA